MLTHNHVKMNDVVRKLSSTHTQHEATHRNGEKEMSAHDKYPYAMRDKWKIQCETIMMENGRKKGVASVEKPNTAAVAAAPSVKGYFDANRSYNKFA